MGDIVFRSPCRQKWQQSLLDLFENYIYAVPKEGEQALSRSRKHSPTDGATWGWGAKGYGKPGRPYAEALPTKSILKS